MPDMHTLKNITTTLIITLLLSFTGFASATLDVNLKTASGVENLAAGGGQQKTGFNLLFHQGKIDFSYDDASGSPVATKSAFSVSEKQLGKKLGRHVEDFGGNPSNAADRKRVIGRISDIANNPDKIVSGTFSGQGANGARGSVIFRIQGNDVVITKPGGEFVTILKDGINSTSVQNALKGL